MDEPAETHSPNDTSLTRYPQSSLTSPQQQEFRSQDYFPEAPELRFELPIECLSDLQTIRIQTSTGEFQPYQKYGKIRFPVEDQQVELTIYANEHGFFLPFRDGLAGIDTYTVGRRSWLTENKDVMKIRHEQYDWELNTH